MDKTKIFEAAGKFAAKGHHDKAAKEYQRILDEDPKDVRALQKLAEIYQKNNKPKEATELMLRVAEGYSEQGFFLKAVAVYKQIMKVGPERIDVNLRLAQLYQQLGLIGDATQQFQLVANFHDKAGNVKESLAALRRMVDLDPDNVASRVKLGELYARERMVTEAVTELKRASSYLKKNNRADDHLRVLERIGQLVPEDAGIAKELAQAFLARGDAKRALARLHVCFRQNPKEVETLTLLARAFGELGQEAKTVSVYRELVHVYAEAGQREPQRRTLEKILELSPGDVEAADALRELQPSAGASAPPQPVRSMPAAAPPATRPTPAAPARSASVSAAPAQVMPATVAKILTETDVYLKYGLIAKAAEHIQRAVGESSTNLVVNEKLLAILDKQGKADAALKVVVRLVELTRESGDAERDRIYTQELGQRAPGHHLVASAAAAAELGEDDKGGEVVIEPDELELAATALADAAASDDVFEEISTEATIPPNTPPVQPAMVIERSVPPPRREPTAGPAPWDVDSADSEDDAVVVEGEDEAGPEGLPHLDSQALDEALGVETGRHRRHSQIDPFAIVAGREEEPDDLVVLHEVVDEATVLEDEPASAPGVEERYRDDADSAPVASAADESPFEDRTSESAGPASGEGASPFDAHARAQQPEAADGEDSTDLFSEEVEEAEFLVQQGLVDDARYALEAILAQAPNHPRATELFQGLQPAELTSPPGAAPGSVPRDDRFNLGAELADELDGAFEALSWTPPRELSGASPGPDGQYSMEDVLSEFKQKLATVVPAEDSQTHYDLGIAYKEMGLFDEAINEFKVAMSGTGRRRVVDCLTMVGVCTLEKGRPGEAIAFFEQALKTPGLTLEASKEAHYEIGHCLDLVGEERASLGHYARVFKADPTFRDVKARVVRLQGKVARLPPKPTNGAAVPAIGRASVPAPVRPRPAAAPSAAAPKEGPPPIGRGGKIGYI